MSKNAISVRVPDETIEDLDKLAKVRQRDRSFLVNEAIDLLLDMHQWQIQHIKEGLRQAKEGKMASKAQVQAQIDQWLS
jgi:predicted transcriptional regulator